MFDRVRVEHVGVLFFAIASPQSGADDKVVPAAIGIDWRNQIRNYIIGFGTYFQAPQPTLFRTNWRRVKTVYEGTSCDAKEPKTVFQTLPVALSWQHTLFGAKDMF